MEKRNGGQNTPKKKLKLTLPLFLQKTAAYRYIFARKRNSRTTSGSKSVVPKIKINFKPIAIIAAVILVGFLIFNIGKYLSFNTQKVGSEEMPYEMDYENFTVLIVGLDDRVEGYEFASIVTILDMDINSNIAKLYTINPSFLTKNSQGYSLKSLWNNFEREKRMEGFVSEVENLMAVDIDNYLVFKKSELNSIYEKSAFSVTAKDDYAIGNDIIKEGESMSMSEALDLIMTNGKTTNDTMKLQQDFVKAFIDQFKNKLYIYQIFLSPDSFLPTIKTGLNKNDFINLLMHFADMDILNSGGSIMGVDLGTPSEKDIDILVPNMVLLDENLGANFRLFDVIKEQSQLEMYNASQGSGVATKFQRMAQNRGANVIKIGNYSEVLDASRIYLNLKNIESYKNTLNLIYDLLPSNVKIVDISEYKYNYSGDIIIVLGKDVIN